MEWLDELLPCTIETDALYLGFSFFSFLSLGGFG
jgi:hypothetical protein